jgi:hypothetical protein
MLGVGLAIPFLVASMNLAILFMIFGLITFGHGVFTLLFVKETANLTDKQKKCLYSPNKNA